MRGFILMMIGGVLPLFRRVSDFFGKIVGGVGYPFSFLLKPLTKKIVEKVESGEIGFFDFLFKDSVNPLLAGRKEEFAKWRWSKDQHPALWQRVPEDLVRTIDADGRCPDGTMLGQVFGPGLIDKKLVSEANREALEASIGYTFGLLILSTLAVIAFVGSMHGMHASDLSWSIEQEKTMDFWSEEALTTYGHHQDLIGSGIARAIAAVKDIGSFVLIEVFAVMFCLAFGVATWIGNLRRMPVEAAEQKSLPLRLETKENIVRYKRRMDQREEELKAYSFQLEEAARDKSHLIDIGVATGQFLYRGQLSAPTPGQNVRCSVKDLFQNTIVFGGTGSGKTYAVVLPLAAQLIDLMDREDISLYVTDSKAVLAGEIKELAAKFGRQVQIIGVEDGEVGVDLLDGVKPALATDMVKSVMRQIGSGASGDDFWPDMASEFFRNILVLARAWERTAEGVKFSKSTGDRPYSLAVGYRISLDASSRDANSMVARMVDDIFNALENEEDGIRDLFDEELTGAIRYLRTQWIDMADNTRTGIEANLKKALSGFETDMRLRNRFASGRNGTFVMRNCWDHKITCVRLPETELGIAGKIVNVALKTLLMSEAMRRQVHDPDIRFKQKLAFIADEYQTLVTSDISGVSDSSFWNVSRSTGTFGVLLTQGQAAIEQAIGDKSAHNFRNNMRNKIFLQIEELETMNFAKTLAGKALRFHSYETDDFESLESFRREAGFDPLAMAPATLRETGVKPSVLGFMDAFGSVGSGFSTVKKYDADQFYYESFSDGPDNNWRDAAFRAEDKNMAYMTSGNDEVEVLRDDDLTGMGQRRAYVMIWRGGHARQDIVHLPGADVVIDGLLKKRAERLALQA